MSATARGVAPQGADEAQQADRTSRGKGSAPSSRAAFFLVGAMLYAPYQCGKAPERSLREETPGEALYGLAQKMKADGDEQGYRTTLRYIVARYPSSRYAAAARMGLSTDAADGDGP